VNWTGYFATGRDPLLCDERQGVVIRQISYDQFPHGLAPSAEVGSYKAKFGRVVSVHLAFCRQVLGPM
jgi:hypothetical protein